MNTAPMRYLNVALWPVMIWTSLTHLEEHPADDYVERTSPIVATAVAFWIALIALVVLANPRVMGAGGGLDGEAASFVHFRMVPQTAIDVLWFFVPSLYVIGLWLFASRDEAFPR